VSVTCASCQRTIQVPPDKAAVPNLKVKCRCGNVFAVASALAAAPGSPAFTTVPPVPVVPPVPAAPRVPASAGAAPPAVPRPATAATPAPVVARPAAPVAAKPANGEVRGPAPAARSANHSATVAPVPRAVAASGTTAVSNWRKCANHSQERADSVCPKCMKGYCPSCVQVVQGGAICALCDGLCVSFQQYEESAQMARQRERPMKDDLELIMTYPLRDRMGFVLLALFTWFFGLFAGMAPIAFLLSQGVLLWYTFYALGRVASGNLRDFMPDMRDIGDLVQPARLAFAAFLISSGPMILVTIFFAAATLPLGIGGSTSTDPAPRGVVHAQAEEEEPAESAEGAKGDEAAARRAGNYEDYPEEKPGLIGPILLLIAVAWKILYTPVALVVAALSRSFVSTINPVIGIWAIQKMGSIYWQCLGIYCVLASAQWILGLLLGFIPIAGGFVAAFINAYAYLAIACTLGLGVFKKAPELGWD
jgi:hypothetical protein